MHWQIGDRAICITPGSRMEGLEVTILAGPLYGVNHHTGSRVLHYEVDPGYAPTTERPWGAEPQNLRPIPDSYNGLSVTTWDAVPPAFRLSRFPEKVTV